SQRSRLGRDTALPRAGRAPRYRGVGRLGLSRRKRTAAGGIRHRGADPRVVPAARRARRQERKLMAAALLTAIVASVAGIAFAIYLGLTAGRPDVLSLHISI